MRRTTPLATLVAFALIGTACGNDEGEGDSAAQDSPDSVEETDAAADETEEPEYPEEDLLIGLPAPNQIYSAMYVALDQGWFEEESFNADVVITQSSTASIQQAASASVHVGGATPDAAVFGITQGADVTMMAVTIEGSPLSVVTRSDVTDWEDLQGETIGVSALKGGEIALLRRLLEENGLAEGDYDVVVSGATPAKAAALAEGSVAAAVLFSPTDYALEAEGYTILGSTAELPLADQIPLTVYAVNNAWAAENDRGDRLARVLVRANQWLTDPANRDQAVEIFAAAADQQPEHVAATYELWFDQFDIGTPTGQITAEEVQNTLEMMAADGDLTEPLPDPTEFFNPAFIENAANELDVSQ
jgi:ABC-type nitrate/sulfonate/bicarbonate transport system substrate-binding protein